MSTTLITKNEPNANLPEMFAPNKHYPDVRFYCPYCGSLDVYLSKSDSSMIMAVCCLDCERKWRRYK